MYREKSRHREDTALGDPCPGGLGTRDVFLQLHVLLLARQEVSDTSADGFGHIQLGELVLQKTWDI